MRRCAATRRPGAYGPLGNALRRSALSQRHQTDDRGAGAQVFSLWVLCGWTMIGCGRRSGVGRIHADARVDV
jgi:hypothetical protein